MDELPGTMFVRINEKPNYFERLPAIAERLGVQPIDRDHVSTVVLSMPTYDGRAYDLFELIGAFLDRVDAVSK